MIKDCDFDDKLSGDQGDQGDDAIFGDAGSDRIDGGVGNDFIMSNQHYVQTYDYDSQNNQELIDKGWIHTPWTQGAPALEWQVSTAGGRMSLLLGKLGQGRALLFHNACGGSFARLIMDDGATTKCIRSYQFNSCSCIFHLRKRHKIYKKYSKLVASTWTPSMTGLLLLAVIACWIFSLGWFVKKIGNLLSTSKWNRVAKLLVFALLLPLPLIDEIIAKPKFEALCREKAIVTLDTKVTRDRTVWFGGYETHYIALGTLKHFVIHNSLPPEVRVRT